MIFKTVEEKISLEAKQKKIEVLQKILQALLLKNHQYNIYYKIPTLHSEEMTKMDQLQN